MTLVGPDGDCDRRMQEECCQPCEQLRTYLIYHLARVEHHATDQRRRMVISDSGLEIELGLLRELNNCIDQFSPARREVAALDARSLPCGTGGDTITKRFHPGFKVTVVLNGGDEKTGIVRWTRDDSTGHDLQLL